MGGPSVRASRSPPWPRDTTCFTVEGLSAPPSADGAAPALDLVQEAFLDRTGYQCSYCTPGILLTAKALLAEQPNSTDEEIREYMAGSLCRCGSYVKILDSMHEAIARLRLA